MLPLLKMKKVKTRSGTTQVSQPNRVKKLFYHRIGQMASHGNRRQKDAPSGAILAQDAP
jgi:hypothetical protein